MLLDKFNSTMTMENKIGVIIPKVNGYRYFEHEFNYMFSRLFGGSSQAELKGYYVMDSGKLEFDNSIFVYAYYSEMNEKDEKQISELIELMKVALKQECIGIEYNNQFTLVF